MASSRLSESDLNVLYDSLMRDPVQKKRLLKLFKRDSSLNGHSQQPVVREHDKPSEPCSSISTALSNLSGKESTAQQPFSSLLSGVTAFVDVKKNGEDRSVVVKRLMRKMGASVLDVFNSAVTHLVFKDGSYSTYEKAKRLNIHVVSVLWIDAIRRKRYRVPESKYPTFAFEYDTNNRLRHIPSSETNDNSCADIERAVNNRSLMIRGVSADSNSSSLAGFGDKTADDLASILSGSVTHAEEGHIPNVSIPEVTSNGSVVSHHGSVHPVQAISMNRDMTDEPQNSSDIDQSSVPEQAFADYPNSSQACVTGTTTTASIAGRARVITRERTVNCVSVTIQPYPAYSQENNPNLINIRRENGAGRPRAKRKLYNPDDTSYSYLPPSSFANDEAEREMARTQVATVYMRNDMFTTEQKTVATQTMRLRSIETHSRYETRRNRNTKSVATQTVPIRPERVRGKNPKHFCPKRKIRQRKTKRSQPTNKENVVSEKKKKPMIVPSVSNRRSSMEFEDGCTTSQKSKRFKKSQSKPTIVCTMFHRHEVHEMDTIVKKLGKFEMEFTVSRNTSHLVCGELKRTVNMLRALIQGCWILKIDWLYKSAEKGMWLDEEDFEATEFSSSVKQNRLDRQAFGPYYKSDLFKNFGLIYVSSNSKPSRSDMEELVALCKGTTTRTKRMASVVIGEGVRRDGMRCECVTESWLLDCITQNKLLPTSEYLIERETQVSLTGRASPIF